jgi:hypothetical protein
MDHVKERPVGSAQLVRRMQTSADVGDDAKEDPARERSPVSLDDLVDLPESVAVDPLHHEVQDAVLFA